MARKAECPEVSFHEVLFCPHCGTRLIAADERDLGLGKCPHFVFAWLWNCCDDDYLMAVRPDFAAQLLPALLHSVVASGEADLNEAEQAQLLAGDFAPDGSLAAKMGRLCPEGPVREFAKLLKPGTVYYVDELGHSGLRVAIDGGHK